MEQTNPTAVVLAPVENEYDQQKGQQENRTDWRVGTFCEMYSQEAMKWIEGEIINIFTDEIGKWMRVQTGKRIRDVLCDGLFCRERITDNVTDRMTWFNVVQCVTQELFPVLSIKLNECVQEKIVSDSSFKMDDFKADAVENVIARLGEKRTMNNKEIAYLQAVIKRVNQSPKDTKIRKC